jgi:colicin import membrane protein
MRDDVQEQIRQAAEDLEFAPVEVQEIDPVLADIAKRYPVTDAAIAELKAKFAPLDIAGVEDKKGYALVHDARMTVRGLRTDVERKRKALKEDSLEYGRKVDAEAKRITKLLEEIESPLEAKEKAIDAELERIKQEKQREKDAMIQRRINALAAVGHPVNLSEIAQMNETVFQMVLKTATEAFEERERLRIAAEAALAEKRAEEERRAREEAEAKAKAEAAERARLAEEAKALEAQRAALRKEQEEFEAKRRAQEQAAREEQIRRDAEARAKADAERKAFEEAARKEREAKEAAEKAAQAEAQRKAREAARPDAEKLLALAETVRGIGVPVMATPDGQRVAAEILEAVGRMAKFIEAKANSISSPVFG